MDFQASQMSPRERALYDGEDELNDMDIESKGETTSTGGRSKHMSMDLAGSVFLIASDGRVLSLPIPSESPYDPLNWTKSRRIFIFTILVLFATIALFLIQTPGNMFVAFAAAFSEQTLLQLIDLTFIHERPLVLAFFWSVSTFLSLILLGTLADMIDTTSVSEWRLPYKASGIAAGVITILVVFFVPETYFLRPPVALDGRVLVQSGTEKVKIYDEWREVPGSTSTADMSMRRIDETLATSLEAYPVHTWRVSPLSLWRRSIAAPKAGVASFIQIFLCLGNPLVFWVALLNAVNFGGMMSIGTGFPVTMAQPPYNLPPHAVGRVFITSACTCLLALPASYYMLNNIMKRLTLRNRGVRHAEFYLPAFVLPVVSGAVSVFVYGFGAGRSWHPVIYHVSYGLNSFAFTSGSIANTVWVTESLPQWAAPAIGVVGGVSYIASWGITAALPAWDGLWGVEAVNIFLGIGILLVGLFAVPLAFWGRSVRQFISGRWGQYEAGALRPQSRQEE